MIIGFLVMATLIGSFFASFVVQGYNHWLLVMIPCWCTAIACDHFMKERNHG